MQSEWEFVKQTFHLFYLFTCLAQTKSPYHIS